ncbi:NACHT domain-containing protein [Pseudomonas putida]|uniref:NACHT domain-containing protein n=1 Tax=Pseudomonas putida TaxID=303 RepID=UPI000281E78E|nr:hypothetical protein [Pseudomonas putida]EMR47911.1 hypothetical protein PPUTLS46_008714 [Pseudomonas putida LS46]
MNGQSDAFIQLNRTFSKIVLDADVSDDADLSARQGRAGKLLWPDLLSQPRVILLSEAGSGKTAEIRDIAHQLRSEGKTAFFLRIEYVISLMDIAFEVGSYVEFQAWCESGTEGWLLMDSVDEAKLRSPSDFELAMRKLGVLTKQAAERAHIVITGRISAWRAKSDLQVCQREFPVALDPRSPVRKDEPSSPFVIVTLDDIQSDQIDTFLKAKGVEDIERFKIAVDRKEAHSLTTRPLDFLELVNYWKSFGRIGSRAELMRASIDRRLREHDSNRSFSRPIAPSKLRVGARLLAAATTLGQTSAIRIPDGDKNNRGLPLDEVLRDWDEMEWDTLLSRPIFDKGIYGTARFHHRSVREYLAAEWLHQLILNEASRHKVEGLFFKIQYGLEVIDPTMRPVLTWLAILDPKICARVERVDPSVFFEGGDPSQLPLATRRNVLRKACEHLAQPAHTWGMTDHSAIMRFAQADLIQDIKSLLELYGSNNDVSWFLLKMIWQGEVVGALPEATEFALNAQHKHSRLAAIRVVLDLGAAKDIADVRNALLSGNALVNRACFAELLDGFTLEEEWLPWLLQAIERSEKTKRYNGTDALASQLCNLAKQCSLEMLPALIHGVSILLDEPPLVEQGFCKISEQHCWVAEMAGIAVLRLLETKHSFAFDGAVLSVLCKLPQSQLYNRLNASELCESLRKAVTAWPELDYQLFWYDVALARKARVYRNEAVVNVWQLIGFQPFWSANKDNFYAAIDTIASSSEVDDRLMALSMAFTIYCENGRQSAWESRLQEACESQIQLREKLEILLNPPPREPEEWEIKQAQWREENSERRAREESNRRTWREGLIADVSKINGKEPGVMTRNQGWLMDLMRDGSTASNTWSSGEWQTLIEEFGLPVAQELRGGAVAFWRGYRPTLLSEGAAPNTTPYPVIFGLAGLAIEAREEPTRFSLMSLQDAEYAARYGMLELNGFPSWFPQLLHLYPQPVLAIVLREIEHELSAPPSEFGHYILSKARWGGEWMYESLATPLMALLDKPTASLEALQLALTIVQSSLVSDEVLARLACKRAEQEKDSEVAPTWYAVWVGTDPAAAIPALAARIDRLPTDAEKAHFAMLCLTVMVGNRTAGRCRQNYKTVEHAKSLYLLIQTHVRIADDIDRIGGDVYSPGLRDDAQGARDALLAFIRETPGKEAFLALEDIARVHPAERLRPWCTLYAQQKATADSQTPPWAPSKVADFHQALESTPVDHRELWNLAIDRLLDLKHDLEDGDSSIAEILLLATQETSIRKFIGNWCRERAAGRYVIPQEEQLADDKRPDFRMHGCQFDGPVPIELKLADKWNGSQLFERLENQLGGDYLRDIRSSCGIFLLVNHGGKKTWKTPGRKGVAFAELVSELQQHWQTLAPRYPNVEDIMVIGIDLTKRGAGAGS